MATETADSCDGDEDCPCDDVEELSSVTATETGTVLHTAYRCRDCGHEFVE